MTACEYPDSPRLEPHTCTGSPTAILSPRGRSGWMLLYVPKGRENVMSRNSSGVQSTPQHGPVKFLFSVLCFQHTGKKKQGCSRGRPPPRCMAASARAERYSCWGADGNIPVFRLKSYRQEGTTGYPLVPRFSKPCFWFTSKYYAWGHWQWIKRLKAA